MNVNVHRTPKNSKGPEVFATARPAEAQGNGADAPETGGGKPAADRAQSLFPAHEKFVTTSDNPFFGVPRGASADPAPPSVNVSQAAKQAIESARLALVGAPLRPGQARQAGGAGSPKKPSPAGNFIVDGAPVQPLMFQQAAGASGPKATDGATQAGSVAAQPAVDLEKSFAAAERGCDQAVERFGKELDRAFEADPIDQRAVAAAVERLNGGFEAIRDRLKAAGGSGEAVEQKLRELEAKLVQKAFAALQRSVDKATEQLQKAHEFRMMLLRLIVPARF